jgi:hypothetical protein
MADRKVLNKRIDPTFDPAIVPKAKRPRGGQVTVRIMLPMSVQCTSCNEYIYAGSKFNAKKELAADEKYCDRINIWRFFFRCTHCKCEIRFKTNPKDADYTVEHGAQRNYQAWRQQAAAEQLLTAQRHDDDTNAMNRIENATNDSKQQMAIADAIEMMQSRNEHVAAIDPLTLLASRDAATTADDDNAVAAAFAHRRGNGNGGSGDRESLDTAIELVPDDDTNTDYTTSDDIIHQVSSTHSLFAALVRPTTTATTTAPEATATDTSPSLPSETASSLLSVRPLVVVTKKKDSKGKKKKSKKTSSRTAKHKPSSSISSPTKTPEIVPLQPTGPSLSL